MGRGRRSLVGVVLLLARKGRDGVVGKRGRGQVSGSMGESLRGSLSHRATGTCKITKDKYQVNTDRRRYAFKRKIICYKNKKNKKSSAK